MLKVEALFWCTGVFEIVRIVMSGYRYAERGGADGQVPRGPAYFKVRLLGKLGSRLGPPILGAGRQFCKFCRRTWAGTERLCCQIIVLSAEAYTLSTFSLTLLKFEP